MKRHLPECFGDKDLNCGDGEGCDDQLACREETYIAVVQEMYPNGDIFRGFGL